jgi:hypothetical protein
MKRYIEAISEWVGALTTTQRVLILVTAISVCAVGFSFLIPDVVKVSACSPEGFPARCYHITEDVCTMVWEKSKESCENILKNMSLPPGRLYGPYVLKCRMANLDRAFSPSRKSNAECDAMFKDLDDWKSRNQFR